jgi:hypothetical protein
VNWGLGGMTSGLGMGARSDFLRFLGAFFNLDMLLVFGSCGSGDGASFGGGTGGAEIGGGEFGGKEEGGDIDVISTEGERARCIDEFELGDGESSGAGGGGSTK